MARVEKFGLDFSRASCVLCLDLHHTRLFYSYFLVLLFLYAQNKLDSTPLCVNTFSNNVKSCFQNRGASGSKAQVERAGKAT